MEGAKNDPRNHVLSVCARGQHRAGIPDLQDLWRGGDQQGAPRSVLLGARHSRHRLQDCRPNCGAAGHCKRLHFARAGRFDVCVTGAIEPRALCVSARSLAGPRGRDAGDSARHHGRGAAHRIGKRHIDGGAGRRQRNMDLFGGVGFGGARSGRAVGGNQSRRTSVPPDQFAGSGGVGAKATWHGIGAGAGGGVSGRIPKQGAGDYRRAGRGQNDAGAIVGQGVGGQKTTADALRADGAGRQADDGTFRDGSQDHPPDAGL